MRFVSLDENENIACDIILYPTMGMSLHVSSCRILEVTHLLSQSLLFFNIFTNFVKSKESVKCIRCTE